MAVRATHGSTPLIAPDGRESSQTERIRAMVAARIGTDRSSMVQVKLRAVQDGPEDVGTRPRFVWRGRPPLKEGYQDSELIGPRATGQCRQVERFDPPRRVQERGLDNRPQH